MKTIQIFERALVLGAGRSGRAAQQLLESEQTRVVVLEDSNTDDSSFLAVVKELDPQVAIVSPGFAVDHSWLNELRARGIPLLAELELGWSRFKGKTLAVTGSNGKSSAVKWICDALRCTGHHAEIGGNYGIPACEVVMAHPAADWLVLEISSFQLETVRDFRADGSAILNWLPNHLNRHGTMDEYLRMKSRVFEQAQETDFCWIPAELAPSIRALTASAGQWQTFGESAADSVFKEGCVTFAEQIVDLKGTYFDNPTLGPATGAAVCGLLISCGVPVSAIEKSAKAFEPLPHRAQQCAASKGVIFINDSKATNLSALAAAVRMQHGPVRLIAGGRIKEKNLDFIKEILAEKTVGLYLVGESALTMYNAWHDVCECYLCHTVEQATNAAWKDAKSGEVVLLSPGCASFDQFDSFEQRGQHFMELARSLVE